MTEFEHKLLRAIEMHKRELMVQSSMLGELVGLFKMYLIKTDNFEDRTEFSYDDMQTNLANDIRADEWHEKEIG